MKNNTVKIYSILAVTFLLSMSFVPLLAMTDEDSSAATEEAAPVAPTGDIFNDILVNIGNFYTAVGGVFYSWAGYNGGSSPTPAGNDSAIKVFARNVAMKYTSENLVVLTNTGAMLLDNQGQTWLLAEDYFDRAAEVSAGTLWSKNGTYNADYTLFYGGIYNSSAMSQNNLSTALNYAFKDGANNRINSWLSSDDYNSIQTAFKWDGGSSGIAVKDQTFTMYFTQIAVSTSGHDKVYLQGGENITIWAEEAGSIVAESSSTPKYLSAGVNTVTLESGMYTLGTGRYAGPFLTSQSADKASVDGGVVLQNGTSYGYITYNGTTEKLQIIFNGTSYASSTLYYDFTADGNSYQSQSGETPNIPALIKNWAVMYDNVETTLASAAVAGQTLWTIYANTGEKNVFLSPSSISSKLTNVGISAVQSYALYISSLAQMADYYTRNSEALTASEVSISSESMTLYCRGNLYNADGTILKSNVIFTPMVYVSDMVINDTEYNTFTQDGICMIWSSENAYSDISSFSSTSVSTHLAMMMPEGSYFDCSQISYNGNLTHNVTLHVKSISEIKTFDEVIDSSGDEISAPKVLSASVLVFIIMLELAVIIAMIGLRTKVIWFFVAAVIILVLGIVLPETIASLLTEWFGS